MDPDPIFDGPTERFSLQTCPHCDRQTIVALALAEDICQVCGEPVVVAPMPQAR